MKDKKVRKRYSVKMHVVKIQSKNSPSSFLANYSFYRSKRAADAYADVHRFPASDNIVKKFTMKASKGKELILFLRNVANAVLIAQSRQRKYDTKRN